MIRVYFLMVLQTEMKQEFSIIPDSQKETRSDVDLLGAGDLY